ncbi:globin [Novosphingobium sp. Rr 2-17]|uniref:group II truncated hemoglobin n=1 Tax=Novosphingobium sp. Rr 2-17 TaxID=555793 RepID=UPI000269A4F7|nr:group II truncated hemoglobin [Novosphingobium sp. Rr 2-17]EIZ79663.1 globin [Novosphingobium sp. Rr 2-17]
MPEAAQVPSMFERIGGVATIEVLVESFYRLMDSLPEAQGIRALHPDDLAPTKRDLKRYLAEWTGGPALYSPEKGHPRMRQRHMHIAIGNGERDAWLLCMSRALDESIVDETARHEIYALLAKLADWMRNRAD